MRTLLLLLLALTAGGLSAQSSTFELTESVYFSTAESRLDAETKRKITDFKQRLSAYADFTIRLEAFTDERGDEQYNEALATARAASVRTFLEATGTVAREWSVTAFGERRARQNGTDEDALRADRRVDLVASVTGWTDTESALAALRSGMEQTFTASGDSAFTVVGKRGGRFLIDPNSFVDTDGKPATGSISLSLIEAYTFDDILLAGLTTHSGDRLLETGGMFRLTAMDEYGNPLALADSKSILGAIPTDDFNAKMRLFVGREHGEDSLEDSPDWELTTGAVSSSATSLVGNPPFQLRSQQVINIYSMLEAWERRNPKPVKESRRPIPRIPADPVFPDTAAVVWKPVGLDKILASSAKKEMMRQQKVDKSVQEYNRNVRRKERAITMRAANGLFNSGIDERFDAAMANWLTAKDEMRESLTEKYKAENEALRRDYERRREEYLAKRKAFLEASLTGDNLTGQQGNLSRYFFSVTQLGWANCDVFYGEDDPVEVLVEAPDTDLKTTIILIPSSRRAVLAYRPKAEGSWGCAGVPRGKEYTLIAYQIREGRIEFARRVVNAAREEPESLEFRPVALEELKGLFGEMGAAK